MSREFSCLMVGLHATGKTTFLAATWYVVNHTDEVPGALRLNQLKGDDHYLGGICADWLQYKEVQRTKVGAEGQASMELRDDASGTVIEVAFPDLSGERFRQQVEERHTDHDYIRLLSGCDGVLLFTHTGTLISPTRIDEAEDLVAIIDVEEAAEPPAHEDPQPWDPKMLPSQVKLVELLQILEELRGPGSILRVGLILSAWDLVQDADGGPEAFVQNRLPLLHQFISTNTGSFQVKSFGVSAQGAPLDSEAKRKALASETYQPASRIMVKDGSRTSMDITTPIKWLMESDAE